MNDNPIIVLEDIGLNQMIEHRPHAIPFQQFLSKFGPINERNKTYHGMFASKTILKHKQTNNFALTFI